MHYPDAPPESAPLILSAAAIGNPPEVRNVMMLGPEEILESAQKKSEKRNIMIG